MLNSTNDSMKHLNAEYAALPAKFDERKEQMVQADAYKRKARAPCLPHAVHTHAPPHRRRVTVLGASRTPHAVRAHRC